MKFTQKSGIYLIVFSVFFGLIFTTGPIVPSNIILRGLYLLAIIILGWSVYVMNFRTNIFPELLPEHDLITEGPFSIVRHPMYFSILFITAILVFEEFSILRVIYYLLLFGITYIMIIYEEKQLVAKFPDYKNYQSTTNTLIPFLW